LTERKLFRSTRWSLAITKFEVQYRSQCKRSIRKCTLSERIINLYIINNATR